MLYSVIAVVVACACAALIIAAFAATERCVRGERANEHRDRR